MIGVLVGACLDPRVKPEDDVVGAVGFADIIIAALAPDLVRGGHGDVG